MYTGLFDRVSYEFAFRCNLPLISVAIDFIGLQYIATNPDSIEAVLYSSTTTRKVTV
jgi:hypothetical protein